MNRGNLGEVLLTLQMDMKDRNHWEQLISEAIGNCVDLKEVIPESLFFA
jgi:hypothetical protein